MHSLYSPLSSVLTAQMLPAPAIAAVYLAHYHSNGTISSYFIFAAAAALSVAWFLMHNFYFLSVAVGSVSIKAVCQWLLLGVALALCVPGLTLFPRAQALAGAVAVAQALLVCGCVLRLPSPCAPSARSHPAFPSACPSLVPKL